MKKSWCIITIFVLLFSIVSCKRNDSYIEPHIESNKSSSQTQAGENVVKTDTEISEDDNFEEENEGNSITENKPIDDPVIEPEESEDISSAESQTDTDIGTTQENTEPEEKRSPTKYVEDHSTIPGNTHDYTPFYNWDIMIKNHDSQTVTYNGKVYMRSMTTPQFPAGTVYESVNLSNLSPTRDTVTVICEANDGSYTYWTKDGVICSLPENMKSDPYVDMIAVRTTGTKEKTELYYIPNPRPKAETIEDIFKGNNIYYGSNCLTSDAINQIIVSTYNYSENIDRTNGAIIRKTIEKENATKLYNTICKLEYFVDTTDIGDDTVVEIDFQFDDLSGERFAYFEQSDTVCCMGSYYKATTEFKTLLFSFLK